MNSKKSDIKEIKGKEQLAYEKRAFIEPIKNQYKSGKRSIKISDYIKAELVNEQEFRITLLTATHLGNGKAINPVVENMQTDKSAFESWAICLKVWFPDIKKVTLDWTTPETIAGEAMPHYNRFLYRVIKFKRWYDWFDYASEKREELDKFSALMKGSVNNSSGKTADEKRNAEGIVEYNLIHDAGNLETLKRELSLVRAGNHLPVGVKSADGGSLFTGGQSAIDLWGLTSDGTLKLIELKYNRDKNGKPCNIKIGIIAELMLYCNIMNDIRNGEIGKPKDIKIEEERDLYAIKWKGIEGVMLATDYHPLLHKTKELLELLNSNSQGITFSMCRYEWDMANKKLNAITPFNPKSCE